MDKQIQAISNGTLAADARALMAATADATEEKVKAARRRLAAGLEHGKEFYRRVSKKAVEGARAADQARAEHPYQAISITFCVGALVGSSLRAFARTRAIDYGIHT